MSRRSTLPILLALTLTAGCGAPGSDTDTDTDTEPVIDQDADGYGVDVDCDDEDASVHPDAEERCNEVDDDCDGAVDVDAVDATLYFADTDEDGFGDPETAEASCVVLEGYVEDDQDCDDTSPDIRPDAAEVCDADNVDEDCDGRADDADDSVDPEGFSSFYPDEDADGVGDADAVVLSCDPPEGYVTLPGDCDDLDAARQDLCVDGTWSSTNVNVAVYIVRFKVTGYCRGSMKATIDTTRSPQMQGTMSCVSGGSRSDGTVEGTLAEDGSMSGRFVIAGDVTPWEGTITSEKLEGRFVGRGKLDGYDVTYSGGFTATPDGE